MDNKKILVVEDEIPMLKALRERLEMENLKVIEARDGERGLKLTISEKPDLILLDIVMPKMDGIAMLKKLNGMEEGKDIPVIILTNLSGYENVVEELNNDTYEYLIKSDWNIGDVVNRVKEKLKVV